MTSLPSLPSTWTAPTSCFASTNYYYVIFGGNFFSNMYGTPTPVGTGIAPTGDCFPPSFTINVPYITDGGCPSGYTRACATAGSYNGEPASTVTCCPSVEGNSFSFMCRGHEYGCHGTATDGPTWTGVVTNIGLDDPTEQPITRTPNTAEGIEAWGIKFVSVASATSDASASSTTTSAPASTTDPNDSSAGGDNTEEQPMEQGGLPTATIAGIAVGAVIGCLLLALIAFLLYRRKQKERHHQSASSRSNTEIPKHMEIHQLDAPPPVWELYQPDSTNPRSGPRQAWELPG